MFKQNAGNLAVIGLTVLIVFSQIQCNGGARPLTPAFLTVLHNGVKIQDKIKLTGPTGGAYAKGSPDKGGIYIQDHGHPVEFRNIWVKELE